MNVLAIDVGTGSTRASVVNEDGQVLAAAQETSRGGPTALLDPEDVWETVARVAARAVAAAPKPAAVGVSAQLGWVAVASDGTPLTPVMTWAHQLPAEAAGLSRLIGHEAVYRVAGRRISAELPLAKLLWLKQEQPALYQKTFRLLSLKDYLVYRLTGCMATDVVHGCYTGLFDVVKRTWSTDLAAAAGVSLDILPEVDWPGAEAGKVQPAAAARLGLTPGVPVAVGGPDGTMAGLGAGVMAPGLAMDVMGTTDVFYVCSDRPVFDPEMRTVVNAHPVPGLWMVGGTMGTTGGCLKWFVQQFGGAVRGKEEQGDHAALEALAAAVPPGSGGLLALTGLTGSRAPDWDPLARGAFIGLTPAHGPGELYRAILEGNAYGLRAVLDILKAEATAPLEIRTIGGGARSQLALRICAAVTGCPFTRLACEEATTLGTAMVALLVAGGVPDLATAARRWIRVTDTFQPDPTLAGTYANGYRTHRQALTALAGIWKGLA